MSESDIIHTPQDVILTIRQVQVMIDTDLAQLYGVGTKALNQAVKRNILRFPEAFRFQLTDAEKRELVTNCDRFNHLKHSTTAPYAFTEQGVAMLSAVLRSETAVSVSVQIMQAFVSMRRFLLANGSLLERLDTLEKRQMTHETKTDERFTKLFNSLEDKSVVPTQGIFFEGQVFDAYLFVNDLLRGAKQSIALIDNYVDDSVLMQLTKRAANVSAIILTRSISSRLQQDLKKHNAQYPPITILEFAHSHDRFIIIDGEQVYHIGASLKDLGKKWFAFSRIEKDALSVMERLDVVIKRNQAGLGYEL